MKELRDVPLHYRVAASLLFGGISLLLFGAVFAVVRGQADRAAAYQAWEWVAIAALVAFVAATGALFALLAWGALSDPKSPLGAWVQKRPLADAVHYFLVEAVMFVLLLVGLWLSGIKKF